MTYKEGKDIEKIINRMKESAENYGDSVIQDIANDLDDILAKSIN